jgi:hypothetical protein
MSELRRIAPKEKFPTSSRQHTNSVNLSVLAPGVAVGASPRRGPPATWPAVIAKIPGIAKACGRDDAHKSTR